MYVYFGDNKPLYTTGTRSNRRILKAVDVSYDSLNEYFHFLIERWRLEAIR